MSCLGCFDSHTSGARAIECFDRAFPGHDSPSFPKGVGAPGHAALKAPFYSDKELAALERLGVAEASPLLPPHSAENRPSSPLNPSHSGGLTGGGVETAAPPRNAVRNPVAGRTGVTS